MFILHPFLKLNASFFRILNATNNLNSAYMRLLLLVLPFLCFGVNGQTESNKIRFYLELTNNHAPIQKGEQLQLQGDSFSVESCKMYLSNFAFLDKNNQTIVDNNSIFLIDIFKKNYFELDESLVNNIQQFSFQIKCDTTLTSMPPMTGELSASEGMFWSWTNGFMALKLEGKHSGSSLPHKNYVFHLGVEQNRSVPDIIVTDLVNKKISFEIKDLFLEHSFSAHPSMMEIDELSIRFLNSFSYCKISEN